MDYSAPLHGLLGGEKHKQNGTHGKGSDRNSQGTVKVRDR